MNAELEKQPKVLVIEDEEFFRQMITDSLAESGVTTLPATAMDLSEILDQNDDIGLVLTDLEMPDVSGLEVLQQVKALKPEIPVVVVSGHQDFHALREVLSGGALDYLVKPFSDMELVATVEKGLLEYARNLKAIRDREEAERLLSDLILLREIGETASGEGDLDTLLDRVIDLIVDSVGVQTASLMLPDKNGNLKIRASRGLPDGVADKALIKPGEGLSGHVFVTGKPVLTTDIGGDDRFSPSGDDGQYSTRSALSLPLKGRDRILGVLNVNNKADGSIFSIHDQYLLSSIAHQTVLAIENFFLFSQLREKANELEALNERRSRLVCNLSHELKTPLTSILGFSELLLMHRSQIGEAEFDDYLQKMTDSSLHMERLISGMLLLFSIDSGTAHWQEQPVSVAEICREVVNSFGAEIEKQGLKVELAIDDNLPALSADRDKFRVLLESLVDNAIKFNEHGGKLAIRGVMETGDEDRHIYLQVYNNGASLSPDMAAEVFADYSQLGEINTAKPSGVGIGLALCRAIVKNMNGTISLEETDGVGTSFGLTFPVGPGA